VAHVPDHGEDDAAGEQRGEAVDAHDVATVAHEVTVVLKFNNIHLCTYFIFD